MDKEHRFNSLLQPIRDLTENWDIDIAHLLEDYLDELEIITLPVQGYGNLNFAEAALLIQGSTNIYSRKVEYLYNLVFQALELLTNNKNDKKDKNNQNDNIKSSNNESEEDLFVWNDDISYLLLDDAVKPGVNIDIIENTTKQSQRKSDGSRLSLASDCSRASRSSAILMNSILHDNQNMSMGKSFDGNNTSALKISSSIINDEGAVIFSSFGQIKNNSNRNNLSIGSNQNSILQNQLIDENSNNNNGHSDNYWDNGDDGDNGDFGDVGFSSDPYSPDFNNHNQSFSNQQINQNKTPEKNRTRLQLNNQKQLNNDKSLPTINIIPTNIPVRNPLALLDPHDPSESKNSKEVKKDKRTYRNPLTKQNQLKVNTGFSGLTRKQMMLKSLNVKKKNEESSTKQNSSMDIISMITKCSLYSNNTTSSTNNTNSTTTTFKQSGFNFNSKFNSTTPVSNSLAAYLQQQRKRSSFNGEKKESNLIPLSEYFQEKKIHQNMNIVKDEMNYNMNKKIFNEDNNFNTNNYDDGNNGGDDDDDNDMDGGFSGGYDDNYDNNDNDNHNNYEQLDYGANDVFKELTNSTESQNNGEMNEAMLLLQEEKLLSERVENALNDAGFHNTLEDDYSIVYGRDSQQFETFESLCKKHIQNFIIGSEKYSRETNLTKRVVDWTNKMEPILKEQENRPYFDIHQYSDETLKTIHKQIKEKKKDKENNKNKNDNNNNNNKDKENNVSFSSLVNGKQSYEVSRIFLSCLQLANLGNVDFNQTKENIFDFDVNLLNEKSNRLQIENYRAPSIII